MYEDIDRVVKSVQGHYNFVTKPTRSTYEEYPLSQGAASDSVYATADESTKVSEQCSHEDTSM